MTLARSARCGHDGFTWHRIRPHRIRLSTPLFVMVRWVNARRGVADVTWSGAWTSPLAVASDPT